MYYEELPAQERIANFIYRVYGLMSLALFITASTAYYVYRTPIIYQQFIGRPGALFFLFMLQLIFVFILSAFLQKINFITALIVYFLYAISLGFTFSVIFYVYTLASIYSTFLITAIMFAAIALYGYFTKSDLTKVGSISLMMLFGLILALFINFFLRSPMVDFIISCVGVVIFSLLTAYDSQKIKQLGQRLIADRQTVNKVAILGALTLYLDFINLFLYLLQFTGRRQQD